MRSGWRWTLLKWLEITAGTVSKGHRCPWCWRKASWKPTWHLIRVECFHKAHHIRMHWRLCGAFIAAWGYFQTFSLPKYVWDADFSVEAAVRRHKNIYIKVNWRWAIRTRRVSDVTLIVRAFRTSRGRRSSCRHVDDVSTLLSQRPTPPGWG